MNFSKSLITWYLENKRDLPWRHTREPYQIWLSEIMLQQTRVAQGMPYFFAFLEAFPTVFDLANAAEEQVLKLWQGLGYYSRARNLHKTAQIVAFDLGGQFPDNYKDLLQLKGIGSYTAAAIASFSHDEKVPVVDGNVFRVLARYFDIETDIANVAAKKEFAELALALMPDENPAVFNQAIMEFGALQCVPKNPVCDICPLNTGCLALQKRTVNLLPVKSKKPKAKNRFFHYLIFADETGNTIVSKRIGKGIWENLYEFPLFETDGDINETLLKDRILANAMVSNEITDIVPFAPGWQIHKLTHQHLHLRFYRVTVSGRLQNSVDHAALLELPFPIVLHNFIEKEWKYF